MQSKNTALGILGLVLLAIGLLVWAIVMSLNTYAVAPIALGGVLILAYVSMNIQFLLNKITGRAAMEGANMAVAIVVFAVIVVFLEMLLVRHSARFDFTEVKKYSLASQSIQLVKNLEEELTFLYLENPRQPGQTATAKDLMELYARYSDKISIELIDPQREPQKVEELAPVTLGAIYVKRGEQHEKVSPVSENDLTNALMKMVKGGQKVVYFTQGHDEGSIDAPMEERNSLAGIKDMLEEEGYKVETLEMFRQETVPDDAAVVIVAGPKKPFIETEIATLFSYIENGGNVLFFLDPDTNSGLEPTIEEKLGVTLGNNWILENNPLMQMLGNNQPYIPLLAEVGDHPIVDAFGGQISAIPFPIVRSVQVADETPEDVEATELLKTSAQSWAETNIEGLKTTGEAELNEEEDIPGPVSIAVTVSKEVPASDEEPAEEETEAEEENEDNGDENVEELEQTPEARVVVFGDSDFFKGQNFQRSFDLIVNSVNWATKQEDLISIRAKDDAGQPIYLNQLQGNIIFYTTVVILPALIALLGIMIWVMRRVRG